MRIVAAALLVLLTPPARAQDACPTPPQPAVITAAAKADKLDGAMLTAGQTARVALHPVKDVTYIMAPQKPGEAASQGGLLAVAIADAGTYQVGVSTGAWIDVLQNGAAITSTAHGHAPNCAGLHKMVDFPLAPGRVVIQISGNADATLQIRVSPRPGQR